MLLWTGGWQKEPLRGKRAGWGVEAIKLCSLLLLGFATFRVRYIYGFGGKWRMGTGSAQLGLQHSPTPIMHQTTFEQMLQYYMLATVYTSRGTQLSVFTVGTLGTETG